MRTRICDRVWDVVPGEIWVIRIAVKSELQDAGAWYPKLIAKRMNVRSDQTQILGNERESA